MCRVTLSYRAFVKKDLFYIHWSSIFVKIPSKNERSGYSSCSAEQEFNLSHTTAAAQMFKMEIILFEII